MSRRYPEHLQPSAITPESTKTEREAWQRGRIQIRRDHEKAQREDTTICQYSVPWHGRCAQKLPCPMHHRATCRCGKPATRGCTGQTMNLICGRPICDDCECHR